MTCRVRSSPPLHHCDVTVTRAPRCVQYKGVAYRSARATAAKSGATYTHVDGAVDPIFELREACLEMACRVRSASLHN